MAGGLALTFLSETHVGLGLYLCSFSTFHLLEYVFALTFHPMDCTSDSFLLFRNKKEVLALAASVLEYFAGRWIVTIPSVRTRLPRLFLARGSPRVILTAAAATLLFQAVRTAAMWTAGYNFHHNIRDNPDPDQTLTTSGLYAWSRHPSYFGWFYWILSTQALLGNPACAVLHGFYFWRTFNARIKCEEEALVRDFGREFWEYRSRVGVGIPFIK
jgi:protein-S-isoprenylcysteine O-methyltransferase